MSVSRSIALDGVVGQPTDTLHVLSFLEKSIPMGFGAVVSIPHENLYVLDRLERYRPIVLLQLLGILTVGLGGPDFESRVQLNVPT